MKTKVYCPACNNLIEDMTCCHILGKYRVYYTENHTTSVWAGGITKNGSFYDSDVVLDFNKWILLPTESRIDAMLLLK
jgi:hypothetical protein